MDLDKPLVLEERTVVRKRLNGLRQEGYIPAVIHNHGQDSLLVMAGETELSKVYRAAGKHHPLNLNVGDQKLLALIKDVRYNPVKRRMQHVVFQAINRDEKVEAEVPIRLEGEIPAVKSGLMVMNQLDHIEVEALPRNLPDEIVLDASKLAELHDKITVADISVPQGVTILSDLDQPIVTVIEPRAHAAELDAELAEAAEAEAETEGEEAGERPEGEASPDAGPEASESKEAKPAEKSDN